ncbi:MAG: hypothetical protein R2708_25055 [Vicinamibacterales bacterium]
MTVPLPGPYTVLVGGVVAGTSQATAPAYRGDLLMDATTCTARYGVLSEGTRPVWRHRFGTPPRSAVPPRSPGSTSAAG